MEYNYYLGRKKSPFDERDYNLRDYIEKGGLLREVIKEKVWEFPSSPLNQEKTNHCVGFSMANFGINYPVFTPYKNSDGHDFYYKCKVIDGEPKSEDGSYIRSAAKVLREMKKIDSYAFAPDMSIIKYWILNRSPMIVGTVWTEEMFAPNQDNVIGIGGAIAGGHAYLLNEWRSDNYIGIQNSWGEYWGKNGKAYISAENFEKLFKYDGEAMAAVEIETSGTSPQKECFLIKVIKDLLKTG